MFKDFFACKVVFDGNHHYPEKFKTFFACKIVFDANDHHPENIRKVFCLQNCLRRKSSLSWKNSETFSPAKMSSTQIIIILKIFKDFFDCKNVLFANFHYSETIQRLFRLQSCLGRKSSLSWKFSKTYSPANLSSTQIIIIQKIFKDFFACKNVLATNHLYTENFQRLFFSCKIVLDAIHHYPGIIQRLSPLQNCLRRKSSLSWNYSKTFPPAKLSWTQIIIFLKTFKDFFACKIVLDANHQYPENIQGLFCLQNCLSRNSSLSWNYSKTFSPAKLS